MFDVFKKLMIARQLKIERGEIEMLGQRMVMAPAYTFAYMIKNAENNESIGKLIYNACKHANNDPRGFTYDISKKYNLRGEKLIKWMADIAMTAGWGIISVIKVDEKEKTAIVNIEGSPVAHFAGKSEHPVDHPIRGYMAGATEVTFNDLKINKEKWISYDYIETMCIATGGKYCSFKLMSRDRFKSSTDMNLKSLYQKQIGE